MNLTIWSETLKKMLAGLTETGRIFASVVAMIYKKFRSEKNQSPAFP
jgi:hypothetical protein